MTDTWKGEAIVCTPDAFAGIVEYAKAFDMTICQFIVNAVGETDDVRFLYFHVSDVELLNACVKYYYNNKGKPVKPTIFD